MSAGICSILLIRTTTYKDLFLCFLLFSRLHLFSRYLSQFTSYLNGEMTYEIWSVEEKPVSLFDWIEGDLAFGSARQGIFQSSASLVI